VEAWQPKSHFLKLKVPPSLKDIATAAPSQCRWYSQSGFNVSGMYSVVVTNVSAEYLCVLYGVISICTNFYNPCIFFAVPFETEVSGHNILVS
jgi:hypothetical protein